MVNGREAMNELGLSRVNHIKEPLPMGSYKKEDCIFLLKNINGLVKEKDNLEREYVMQNGGHYSEMLPIEYMPTPEYMALFQTTLEETVKEIAYYVAVVAELIYRQKGKETIIVSLARAGTPIGVLIKRYLLEQYSIDVPHYSVSIIRDRGLDENAILYILKSHPKGNIQFVDGWTGKGVIGNTLKQSCKLFKEKYEVVLDDTLAVLCDPGGCTPLYGTREDFLVPSACLNSTVSGLMSRTFLKSDLIGEYDFHGSKFYEEWQGIDVSNTFVDKVSSCFKELHIIKEDLQGKEEGEWSAAQSVENIRKHFDISSINRVKPGIGETTRVLLRRVPWKILVKDKANPYLKHILLLAKDRGVPVEEYKDMCYACCGLIKDMSGV